MVAKHLFIGNFLSQFQGTIGPTEIMAKRYKEEGRPIYMASFFKNKLLRLFDMIFKSLFYPFSSISIDVYSGFALMFALLTAYIAAFRNKKIILILHGGGLIDVYQYKKKRIRSLLKQATYIVTPSHFLQNFFVSQGYSVEYIPNTIDLELFSYKKEKPHNHSILWVRAFTDNYNPDVAVRAFNKVLEIYPDARMTMVGPDKGNLAYVKTLIKELGIQEKIKLTGRVENAKLPEFYHSHEVYLNTTQYESFGVALLEAAACGIPIVSTSVGEIPLIWTNEENILLADHISEDELATSIIRLFRNRDLYQHIQESAQKNTLKFSWPNVSAQWDDVLTNY